MRLTKADTLRLRENLGQPITKQDREAAVADILRTSNNAGGVLAGKTMIKYGRQRLRGIIP